MRRALLAALGTLLLGGCLGSGTPSASDASGAIAVAVLGDSLMAGYNADASHDGVHYELSWPTGEGNWSFASRMGATRSQNFARPAEKLSALPRQAAGMEHGAFVLVGFGANDLCTGGGNDETTLAPVPPADFERELRGDVRALLANGSRVLVVSVPDLQAMHAVAATPQDPTLWAYFGANCGQPPDQFRASLQAYNEAIHRVTTEEAAMSDGRALWRVAWTREMISEVDGIHPSVSGAHAMAEAAWDAYVAQGGVGAGA